MLRLFYLLQVGVTQVEESGRGARAARERRETTQSLERMDEEESDTAMMESALAGDAAQERHSCSSDPPGGVSQVKRRESDVALVSPWRRLALWTRRARGMQSLERPRESKAVARFEAR